MINITGFEPLDLMLLDSSDKANTIISFIRANSSSYIKDNFNTFLDEKGINFLDDLTYSDLKQVSAELGKKGLSFNA